MKEQNCPICNEVVKQNTSYPNYVCRDCRADGIFIDEDGERNLILDTEINIHGNDFVICWVKGHKCKAFADKDGKGPVIEIIK